MHSVPYTGGDPNAEKDGLRLLAALWPSPRACETHVTAITAAARFVPIWDKPRAGIVDLSSLTLHMWADSWSTQALAREAQGMHLFTLLMPSLTQRTIAYT